MIGVLAYIVFTFATLQLFNVVLNLVFRQRMPINTLNNSRVSVLIPARNEEDNIAHLLADLAACKSLYEVLVYDDQSTDDTAELVKGMVTKDKRFRLIQGELSSGWLGKPHACYQLAKEAEGDYLLFLDADVRLQCEVLGAAVSYMQRGDLSLLSIFPYQILLSKGEQRTVPLMNYILLTLLPLAFVRYSPFVAHSAANGQFMCFEAEAYERIQPHLRVKNNPVEDIAIARLYKQKKMKIACLMGDKRVRCRMYNSYGDALQGFSKNFLSFFGGHAFIAAFFTFIVSFGFVSVLVVSVQLFALYVFVIFVMLIMIAILTNKKVWTIVRFFPAQLIFMWHLLINAIRVDRKKFHQWKGRDIYSNITFK